MPASERSIGQLTANARAGEILRYGAYLCLRVPADAKRALAAAAVPAAVARLGFQNEFDAHDGHPRDAVAYLRCVDAAPGVIADDHLRCANAIVHVASPAADRVSEFCAEAARCLEPRVRPHVLSGVVRPTNFTGGAMHEFAYARQVQQRSGLDMPNAFLLPTRKTPEWWAKDWMERHTYFLPRYNDSGVMVTQGHALAAASGIASLMRRTYKQRQEPAPEGEYDFVNYFECADGDVPTFRAVCDALRDVTKNPEWQFVREGPTWHGRRVPSWSAMLE